MALTKSKGNMYPWVTHTHSHLRGECPHACPYCYVQAIGKRFGGDTHRGLLRMDFNQLDISYGSGRTIFVEHAADLFATAVKTGWIDLILDHCRRWPGNSYVFQTRNTDRAAFWAAMLPQGCMLGTTIETNRKAPGYAPHPKHRARGLMRCLYSETVTRFVTIEPVLDFDTDDLLELIDIAQPEFVNIGADSKQSSLAEPSADKVLSLIEGLGKLGTEIRQKTNLDRILHPKNGGAA